MIAFRFVVTEAQGAEGLRKTARAKCGGASIGSGRCTVLVIERCVTGWVQVLESYNLHAGILQGNAELFRLWLVNFTDELGTLWATSNS